MDEIDKTDLLNTIKENKVDKVDRFKGNMRS